MEKKRTFRVTEFVVEGRGQFPFDMLRYDDAAPCTQADVITIMHDLAPGRRRVSLRRFYEVGPAGSGTPVPCFARWASFMWSVVEVAGKPVQTSTPQTSQDMEVALKASIAAAKGKGF